MSVNWITKALGDCLEKVVDNRGKTPPLSGDRTPYPMIEINAVVGSGKSPNLDVIKKFVTEETYNSWFRSGHPQYGDVLFSTVGSIAEVAIVKNETCCIAQNLIGLRANKELLHHDYLYYFLANPQTKNLLLSLDISSVQPSIKVPHLLAIDISYPSLGEQKEIANLLGSLDERIALLRETNATLEAIAQALFKSWFVDFDPVHANAGTQAPSLPPEIQALFPATFTDSPQGPIPDGWVASVLGDICNNNGGFIQTGPFGSQLHAEDYIPVGTPVVMPKDIVNRRVQPLSTAKIGESDVSRLAKHQLKPGDIVFSRRGDVEKHALIGAIESGWICGTGCLLVRPGKKCLSPSFISRALDLPTTRQWLVRHAVGATMPNLNTGILAAVPMLQPNPDVSIAFDKLVGEIDFGISHNLEKIRTLTILRDTLLPRLISGQLRLHATEQKEAS